jgi:hypothetical protein
VGNPSRACPYPEKLERTHLKKTREYLHGTPVGMAQGVKKPERRLSEDVRLARVMEDLEKDLIQ